jgi:ferredoxin
MKNYADELLYHELSSDQKDLLGFNNRYEWHNTFWERFVIPAMSGVNRHQAEEQDRSPSEGETRVQPSEDEILNRRKIEHFGQVLPIEDVEQVIDMVDSITRIPCGCRFFTTGKTDQRYCFGFGMDKYNILGEFPNSASSLEVLDKSEAKKIFHQYDQEGLIHTIWTGVTPYVVGLCNCDRDCGAYKGYIEMRGSPSFFRGEYICEVDWDFCTGCKECVSQCQFGAQFYSSALERVYIDPTRCYGCGVCRSTCPNDAIELIPRQENPQAAEIWLRDPA